MSDFVKMAPEAAQEWIDALEGPYADRKTKSVLRDNDDCMCCLGVLADIKGEWDIDDPHAIDGVTEEPTGCRLREWGIPEGRSRFSIHSLDGEATGAQLLIHVNDESDTFAPVIAEIRRMFINGEDA